jgi:hypothetical protein
MRSPSLTRHGIRIATGKAGLSTIDVLRFCHTEQTQREADCADVYPELAALFARSDETPFARSTWRQQRELTGANSNWHSGKLIDKPIFQWLNGRIPSMVDGIWRQSSTGFCLRKRERCLCILETCVSMAILVPPEMVVDGAAWAALVLHCEQGAGMGRSCS